MSRQCRSKVELIQLGSAHEKYGVWTRPKAFGSVHEKFGVWIKAVPKSLQRRNSRPGQAKRTPEPFQIETGIPNWFRRRTFHVLNSTLVQWIRFGSWKVRRLLISYGGEYRWSSEKRKETTLLFFYVKAVILVIKSIFQENRNYHGKVVSLRHTNATHKYWARVDIFAVFLQDNKGSRPSSDAVLFMCRTQLNKFDFGATLARHVIQTAYRVSNLS